MKLEVGKYYITRIGGLVRQIRDYNPEYGNTAFIDEYGQRYYENGYLLTHYKCGRDLVQEVLITLVEEIE